MRRNTWILLLVLTGLKAQKLTKEEFSALPQRNKDSHFPQVPRLPNDMLVLISEVNNTEAEAQIAEDTVGLPLGSQEGDFDIVTFDSSLEPSDDALVLSAEDPLESSDLFEGDIDGVKLTASTDGEAITKNAIKNTFQLWPDNEIPYVISNSFGSRERSVIRAAMEQFSENSCVKWRPHVPTDIDYVHILQGQGCHSRVGRTGGAQILSLGFGCVHVGIAVHEMLHASGFWHEQSRPDRDQFVSIHWENIMPGLENNFARYSRAEVDTLSLAYDTGSVMHYAANAFSKNGQYTIRPLKATKISVLGQRRGFSQLDVEKLNKLYQCRKLAPITLLPDPNCKDVYVGQNGLCQTWKSKGGCKRYKVFMKDYCPRTCDLCPLVSPVNPIREECVDKDPRCSAWAAYENQCITNRLFMSKMCPSTCGQCNIMPQNAPKSSSRAINVHSGLAFSFVLLLLLMK